jgi:hypothetical protein
MVAGKKLPGQGVNHQLLSTHPGQCRLCIKTYSHANNHACLEALCLQDFGRCFFNQLSNHERDMCDRDALAIRIDWATFED